MSLVLKEGALFSRADLLLGDHRLPVDCQITVEWLRGIAEPTWYGYFRPIVDDVAVLPLPGAYTLSLPDQEIRILLRRPTTVSTEMSFPFWGVGDAPAVSDESATRPQQSTG